MSGDDEIRRLALVVEGNQRRLDIVTSTLWELCATVRDLKAENSVAESNKTRLHYVTSAAWDLCATVSNLKTENQDLRQALAARRVAEPFIGPQVIRARPNSSEERSSNSDQVVLVAEWVEKGAKKVHFRILCACSNYLLWAVRGYYLLPPLAAPPCRKGALPGRNGCG